MGRVTKRRYLRKLIWARIKTHPGIKNRELVKAFEWSPTRVKNLLHELKREGFAYHTGYSTTSCWYVTDKRPECMWGLHPNSLANLDVPAEQRIEYLRKAGKIPHKDKILPIARPGCALDEYWPVSLSCTRAGD